MATKKLATMFVAILVVLGASLSASAWDFSNATMEVVDLSDMEYACSNCKESGIFFKEATESEQLTKFAEGCYGDEAWFRTTNDKIPKDAVTVKKGVLYACNYLKGAVAHR